MSDMFSYRPDKYDDWGVVKDEKGHCLFKINPHCLTDKDMDCFREDGTDPCREFGEKLVAVMNESGVF